MAGVTNVDCRLLKACGTFSVSNNACIRLLTSRSLSLPDFRAPGDEDASFCVNIQTKTRVQITDELICSRLAVSVATKHADAGNKTVNTRCVYVSASQSAPTASLLKQCEEAGRQFRPSAFRIHEKKNYVPLPKEIGKFLFWHHPDNTITVKVSVDYPSETLLCDDVLPLPLAGLSLECMLLSEKHSDVTLRVDGERLPAHKVVLSARSAVFDRMFEDRWQREKDSDCVVDIDDMRLSVVKDLLRFMYTGVIDPDSDAKVGDESRPSFLQGEEGRLLELIFAADKYMVDDLRKVCEANLTTRFSTTECGVGALCNALLAGSVLRSENLTRIAVRFLRGKREQIFSSDKWKRFAVESRQVAADALIELSLCSGV